MALLCTLSTYFFHYGFFNHGEEAIELRRDGLEADGESQSIRYRIGNRYGGLQSSAIDPCHLPGPAIPIEINLVALAVFFHAERHGDKSMRFHATAFSLASLNGSFTAEQVSCHWYPFFL